MQCHKCIAAAAIIALIFIACGCGGGENGGATPTATVRGQCYDSGDPGLVVPNAVVMETSTGLSATTDAAGNFTLTGLPSGILTLAVTGPSRIAYRQTSVAVQTVVGQVTALDVGLVPTTVAQPAQVVISPRNMTVQNGVLREFQAVVTDTGGNVLPLHPTWTTTNDIGQITRMGILTASNTSAFPIQGQVVATVGPVSDTVPVIVNPSGPPMLSNFVLSPLTVGHNGGVVTLSAQVEDGDQIADRGTPPGPVLAPIAPSSSPPAGYDGVPDIVATIQSRRTGVPVDVLVPLVTGDARFGHCLTTHVLPANASPVGPTGQQPVEEYDVFLTASDALGVPSVAPFPTLTLTVHGVGTPPPPPF